MAIQTIEKTAKNLVLTVQDYSLFAWRAFTNLYRPPIYWPEFLVQADIIGFGSISIVVLTGLSTGGVLALQSAATLSAFGAAAITGRFVSLTMIRELGPILTGVMVWTPCANWSPRASLPPSVCSYSSPSFPTPAASPAEASSPSS
jgi:phospholipid/cholesterol/gamma-HCH transport system permease protein